MLSEENETEGMEVITSVETAPCDVCKSNPRVYKCPRCAAYSCSLECCRQHKITVRSDTSHSSIIHLTHSFLLYIVRWSAVVCVTAPSLCRLETSRNLI